MSETYQAPPAPPEPQPAASLPATSPQSAGGEVPINPNPGTPPAPISNTPPAKVTEAKPGDSRRTVIDKAFERARVERKGPAEAKSGHNRPPEPIDAQESTLDLKKRPTDQPPPRERGEDGRFAARAAEHATPQGEAPRPAAERGAPPLPATAPYALPPKRMAEDAKAHWGNVPEPVRREIGRMHKEFSQAYRQYKDTHAAFQPLRPYYDLARQQGTTLPQALDNYMGIENKLRQDPIGGLDVIVNNLNLRANDGRRIGLADIAYHVLNQTPEQHKLTQAQNQQTAIARQLQAMQQYQMALARQQAQMQYQQRFVHTRGQVDRFAETNPRVDEPAFAEAVVRELSFGFDLPTAYKRADMLLPNGNSSAAQTRNSAPQTRSSDRSISGGPDGGLANGAARSKSTSIRGSVANAMRRVSGAL